jgi:PDZ domain-containing secreted protein
VAPPPDGQGTLDVDLEATGGVGRRRVDWRVAGGVAVVVAVLLVGAFWRVPYFTVAPGSLRATEPLISVEGAPSYPDDAGEIGYLTVTFGQTTPFGLRPSAVLTVTRIVRSTRP